MLYVYHCLSSPTNAEFRSSTSQPELHTASLGLHTDAKENSPSGGMKDKACIAEPVRILTIIQLYCYFFDSG